jgi:hypothetical protein
MEYKTLYTSNQDGADFEYTRWHVLNYILGQGNVVIRSPLQKGRNRPEWTEEEFATVTSDKRIYSFYVEPVEKGKIRNLQIIVGSDNKEDLEGIVSKLMKNPSTLKLK